MQFIKNPLLFIGYFAFAFFLISEVLGYIHGTEEAKKNLYEKNKLILKNLIDAQEKNVQILAEMLSIDPIVIRAYKENDPLKIQKHFFSFWQRAKNEKLTHEIHFFKPPAYSFVNFSDFSSLGKDVSDARKDITWVTSSFKPSTHALVCKTYAGYRATYPIYDTNGTILGGVSLGKKIDWIPAAMKEKSHYDTFLVYSKNAIGSLEKKYYEKFMQDKKLLGDYILADKTFNMRDESIQNIDFSKGLQDVSLGDESYTLFSYPIIDFNGNTLGYISTVTQLQKYKEEFWKEFLRNFMFIFLSAVVVFFITRKKILHIFAELNLLKEITRKIQKRDFSFLKTKKKTTGIVTPSLVELESDIFAMGRALAKQYEELEDENRKKSQQLIEQLYRDELTGLLNRAALFRDLKRERGTFLAIVNIRNFKEINDAFGFSAGNEVLKKLALLYRDYIEDSGFTMYRVGSDEYVLACFKKISATAFEKFIHEYIAKVEATPFVIKNGETAIEININLYAGISFEKEAVLEKAGMALLRAKEQKLEHVVYHPSQNTKSQHLQNIAMMKRVLTALQDDNIVVFYQDIVDTEQKVVKYEALVRMKEGEEIISPYYFLELSRQTRYYHEITRVVIEKTFEEIEKSDKMFSLNLTADDILHRETMEIVYKKIAESATPERIIFELVESDELYNLHEIQEFIEKVQMMGAKIAIDDFGTGYSNFAYMIEIKPDYLKIDGSLIKNLDSDEKARIIVKTIVNFSQELNIKVIAEFVHSKEIFDICQAIGVDEFQGYYFAKPHTLTRESSLS